MTQIAYSTDDPEAVAAFKAAAEALRGFTAQIIADGHALGKNKGVYRSDHVFGGYTVAGLAPDDPNDPPEGWVYSKGRDMLVPRRGKAGDPARAWLDAHKPPKDLLAVLADFGLPHNDNLGAKDSGSFRIGVPTVFELDGTLWAGYRGHPYASFGGPDECTWAPRKLSEFHAALEAREAADEAVPA